MFYLSLRSLLNNKMRYLLTGLTVTLGVCFIVVSFSLSDGFRQAFSTSIEQELAAIDVAVIPNEVSGIPSDTDNVLPAGSLEKVNKTAGVADAVGSVTADLSSVETVAGDKLNFDSSSVGLWAEDSPFRNESIVDGVAPTDGQFVIDSAIAEQLDMKIGDKFTLKAGDKTDDLTLAGLTETRQADGTTKPAEQFGELVATLWVPERTVYELGQFDPGTYTLILVKTVDGTSVTEVQQSLMSNLGDDVEVQNVQELASEIQASVDSQIAVMERVLLGFAFVSIAVAAFIIYNTFAMLISQRMREIGLLRAIGAGTRQIRTSVVSEAAAIGLIAAVVGIGLGLLVKIGLISLLSSTLDADLELPTVLSVRTVVAALMAGVGVTVVAAAVPALRAGSVSPVVAMSGISVKPGNISRGRLLLGAVVFIVGIVGGWFGLFAASGTTQTITSLAVGAVGVFAGVVAISPLLAIGVSKLLGVLVSRIFGLSGQIAAENSRRSPKRTATTSAALMIGLALVTTTLVVGESVKSQVSDTIDTRLVADYAIFTDEDPIPESVATEIENRPEIGISMRGSDGFFTTASGDGFSNEEHYVDGVQVQNLGKLFDLDFSEGRVPSSGTTEVAIPKRDADRRNLSVGDTVTIDFLEPATFTVSGVYQDVLIFDSWLTDSDVIGPLAGAEFETNWMAMSVADGFTPEQAKAVTESATADIEGLTIEDRASFNEEVRSQIDTVLGIVSALLLLSVLIAFIGIGLTLALSVFERTRELGLLRAVGMSRRQMKRMVRTEAIIIALFGALLGIGIGLLFGSSAVAALPDQIASATTVPIVRLSLLALTASVVGLVAAVLPARRAARLDVLDAISVE